MFECHPHALTVEQENKLRLWFASVEHSLLVRVIEDKLRVEAIRAMNAGLEASEHEGYHLAADDHMQRAQRLQVALNVLSDLQKDPHFETVTIT